MWKLNLAGAHYLSEQIFTVRKGKSECPVLADSVSNDTAMHGQDAINCAAPAGLRLMSAEPLSPPEDLKPISDPWQQRLDCYAGQTSETLVGQAALGLAQEKGHEGN